MRVAAVILRDGELVLVRHRRGEHTYHLLPGGGVEAGETLEEALDREVREETGLEVRVERPLFISDTIDPRSPRHTVHVTFMTTLKGGSITSRPADPRVEAVDLVAPDALGTLDLRPPIADALREAAATGFATETRYLGSLWVDEPSGPSGHQ